MSVEWVRTAQTKIYTTVTTRAKKNLKTKYPDISFTEEIVSDSPYTHFPTVVIHFLTSNSVGNTFDGGVNGFFCGVQIDVIVSKTKNLNISDAYRVMTEVLEQFFRCGFMDTQQIPNEVSTTDSDVKRVTARIRRIIGFNDKL